MSGIAELPVSDSRLRVPARSELFLHRPRLVELLDQAAGRPVTLVTGPAGTGKTLAVADWTREGTTSGPVAWLCLGREHASASQLWRSLLAALMTGLGPGPFRDLELPDAPDTEVLHHLVRNLGKPVHIVLDDLQEVDEGTALDWLSQLLRWPPDDLRFVLISRHDPPINLHRLRLEDKLAEVRLPDLAFTSAESRELLATWGLALEEPALARLVDATGGWVAAIRLAALTLRSSDDPAVLLERFTGPTFLVADFLWRDVLGLLPGQYAEFLLRTSVSERMCGSLAAALTGEEDAAALLRTLAHEQFLTHELEGTGWYRTHTLLRKALLARLQTDRPALARELHRTAALWFEAQQSWSEALDQAISSRDWEFAGQLAARSGVALCLGPEATAFADLMKRVPESSAHDHPELAVAMAFAAHSRGDETATERFLRLAEAADELPEPRRSVCALASCVMRARRAHAAIDPIAMRLAAREAEQLLSRLSYSDAPGWVHHQAQVRVIRGEAELWAGWRDVASQVLRSGLASLPSEVTDSRARIGLLGLLALSEYGVSAEDTARRTAEAALDLARTSGKTLGEETKWAWLALCFIETLARDVRAATTIARCAQLVNVHPCPFSVALLQVIHAIDDLSRGDLANARRRLVATGAAPGGQSGLIASYVAIVRIQAELAAKNVDQARSIMQDYDRVTALETAAHGSVRDDLVCVARAQLQLALHQPEQVRPTLAHRLTGTGAYAAAAWLFVALAEDQMRHDMLATQAMSQAIHLAAAQQLMSPFRRPSAAIPALLRRHLVVDGSHREFVEKLLAGVSAERAATSVPPVEPLTERERAVLIYLPTMAANIEIADALSISENTVKQHLKSIYRKLGVHNRREAVHAAREHGLLGLRQPDPTGP
ncbi:MAG: LuxR C-terminal-related transcriptional regulator [Propionicimonas sp.]|uniref:LuxR C-terminal-related transcriptional regulator n=1 Tax=Propionicimonas sp. TaxID=1955623 RepID=UPI002B2159B5|nr:LuxR C-terminal-related transcriptional regulator [Propionicimonas sp.]MEA4944866.1 LuxR C-terminal-related transcriptional regulator [Propionicimonas sp.]